MEYLTVALVMTLLILAIVFVFWGLPLITREKPHTGKTVSHFKSCRRLEREQPPIYEGSSASALAAYMRRSA